jgi:hypothetical protein
MKLVKSDLLKINILKTIADGKRYTLYSLSKKVKTGYDTLLPNCYFLELLKLIEMLKVGKDESATGRAYYSIKITKRGKELLSELKSKG